MANTTTQTQLLITQEQLIDYIKTNVDVTIITPEEFGDVCGLVALHIDDDDLQVDLHYAYSHSDFDSSNGTVCKGEVYYAYDDEFPHELFKMNYNVVATDGAIYYASDEEDMAQLKNIVIDELLYNSNKVEV